MAGAPYEIERKILVTAPDLGVLGDAATSVSDIVQTYLLNDTGEVERVRRREIRDSEGHRLQLTHTAKTAVSAGVVEEREREIDEDAYDELLTRTDPARVPVVKTRWVVPFAERVLEIDRFSSPRELWLLEVELPSTDDLTAELVLPPWLTVLREVTGDPHYANAHLALRDT